MQLTQENNLPALALNGRFQGSQRGVVRKFAPQRLRSYPAAQGKRNRCRNTVAYEHDEKSPPQAEKEPAANRQHTPRKEEDIADCKKEWIANRAPRAPTHYTLLQRLDKINDGKKTRQHRNQRDCYHQRSELAVNCSADLGHPEILRVSETSRKCRQLCRRLVTEKWHDQIKLPKMLERGTIIFSTMRLPHLRARGRSICDPLANLVARLNRRRLCAPPRLNAETVKNYARGVGAIEGVKVNAGHVVIQKIVTLF